MKDKPCVAIASIMDIAPYVQGTSTVAGISDIVKLSSNENPFGPSPKALAAIEDAAKEVSRYADGGCQALRAAIAQHHNISADLIVCGAGSDELIALLSQAYAGGGDEILYNQYGFLMYPISAMRVGATPVAADETNLRVDVDKMIAKVNPKTKIIFIANPNNPTGSYITKEEILHLHANIPPDVLLVLDAAYAEYVEEEDYSSGLELVESHNNIVMLRTFSKIYGMGGIRLGWVYGPKHVVEVLHRVRGPFNVSNLAMKAGIAAISDVQYTQQCVEHNRKWREIISEECQAVGLKIYPSVANFVLVEFPVPLAREALAEMGEDAVNAAMSEDIILDENASSKQLRHAEKNASAADEYLKSKGIIVRQMVAYGLPNCLRFTVGTEEENQKLIEAIKRFMTH